MNRNGADMPVDTALSLIQQAKLMGAKAVQITGGEPFLYNELNQVIKKCTALGLYSFISTSGTGVNINNLREIKNCGLTILCVSLNGSTEEINKKSRAGYEQAIKTVNYANFLNINTMLNFVARKDNFLDLPNLVALAKSKGVLSINILKNFKNSHGVLKSELDKSELKQLAEYIKKEAGYLRVENCYFELLKTLDPDAKIICDASNSSAFVNVNGLYSPCSKSNNIKVKDIVRLKEFCYCV